jgi:hypothetical protein
LQITTNLPTSEEAFENGTAEKTISLEEAFRTEGASKISSFAGVIISATLFGHNYQHLHAKGPAERPDDLANGEFWKRHRRMVSSLFLGALLPHLYVLRIVRSLDMS